MANSRERTFAEKISTWVQIIGIVVATVWGAYTFIYKEITIPRSAPINISVNLELKKIGTTMTNVYNRAGSIINVEMQISMKNPSSRKVDLLPSVWIAYGYTVAATKFESIDSFATRATALLKYPLGFVERGFTRTSETVLSTGRLFTDTYLKPNETVARTHILHIPANTYDVLEVVCILPSAADASKLEIEWNLDSNIVLNDVWFHLDRKGRRTLISSDELESYSKPPFECQYSRSVSQISLR